MIIHQKRGNNNNNNNNNNNKNKNKNNKSVLLDFADIEQFWERGGSVVERRTPERVVGGSKPTSAVLCPYARHLTSRKYW